MTEPENFEDELFADLYNDDEPKTTPAPAADRMVSVQAAGDENEAEDDSFHENQPGDDSYLKQEEGEDEDDEVDFNLGNDSTGVTSSNQLNQHTDNIGSQTGPSQASAFRGPNSKEDGKMFIGGLNWETTDESLKDYFSQFGEVVECQVMRDGGPNGRSRGFGFLTFKDPKTVNTVMVKEHYLDGKIIDPKRAIPREEQERTSKIFVGGVSQETTDHEFREYFAQFGRVVDATLMMDKDTGRPRGFGFVTFESDAGVDACLQTDLAIHGKAIEVKKAQPRGNLREEEEANRRGGNKFGRGKGGQMSQGGSMEDGSQMNSMGGMGGSGMGGGMGGGTAGMSPQVLAQYIQRMQQAFSMMQQQMQMNRMSPAMMQMMQMQQMQQMQQMMAAAQGGRGQGGMGAMAQMNPAMQQQMQQQMQAMMNQSQMQGQMQGNQVNQALRPPLNAYDQQQQQQQQQFEPQQNRRRDPSQPFNQQAGGGYMGGQLAPTSWEGMYDEVPQPMGPSGGGRGSFSRRAGNAHQVSPHDPQAAPPPNAPTGPKNAGRPGANYRGGGRGAGAQRGFHPYARG